MNSDRFWAWFIAIEFIVLALALVLLRHVNASGNCNCCRCDQTAARSTER